LFYKFIKRWDKEAQVAHLEGFWRAHVEERERAKLSRNI